MYTLNEQIKLFYELFFNKCTNRIKNDMKYHICHVVNICEIVFKYIKSNFVNQTQLAKEIGTSKSNLSNRLKGNSLDTTMLYNISIALNHDFFQYLSKGISDHTKMAIIEKKRESKPYVQTEEYVHLLEENIELYRKLHNESNTVRSLKKDDKPVHDKSR